MKNRRRLINYSIKRKMQLRLLAKVMAISLLGILFAGAIFYFYSDIKIEGTYKQFHIHARNFLDYLLPAVAAAIIIGIISVASIAVFFPHSIAGPLHRIERILQEDIGKGNLNVHIKCRTGGDEVTELADAVNIMVERLKSKVMDIDVAVCNIERLAAEISEGEKEAIKLDEAKERLLKFSRELRGAINNFKL